MRLGTGHERPDGSLIGGAPRPVRGGVDALELSAGSGGKVRWARKFIRDPEGTEGGKDGREGGSGGTGNEMDESAVAAARTAARTAGKGRAAWPRHLECGSEGGGKASAPRIRKIGGTGSGRRRGLWP
jgi:hypothetical protein